MFSIVLSFFIVQLTIAIALYIGQTKSGQHKPLEVSENTTIIIPFKNESKRISPLINSINKSAIMAKKGDLFSKFQFIFIDDHSNDQTVNFILDRLDISFQLIRLRQTNGKKYAIKKGVELAQFNRILTLDADVNFDLNYLEAISKTKCNGLSVLPVNMDSKSVLKRLFSVEFWFLQRLTFGLAGYKKNYLCNGANLLFTKSAFNESLTIRQDADIPSGDDVFLLNAINELDLEVNSINEQSVSVNTLPPQNIQELINQRIRWVTKMNDLPSVLGGIFILLSNLFFVFAVYEILHHNYIYTIPIGLKIMSELMSVRGLTKKVITLFHQLTYPLYLIVLLGSLPVKNREWRSNR